MSSDRKVLFALWMFAETPSSFYRYVGGDISMGILLRRISCGWNLPLTKHDNASQFDEVNYSWTAFCAVLSRLAQLAGGRVDLSHWQTCSDTRFHLYAIVLDHCAVFVELIDVIFHSFLPFRGDNGKLLRSVRGSRMETHGVRSEHSDWLPLGDKITLGDCACSFEVRHQQWCPFIVHFQTPAMMIILRYKC